MDLRRLGFISIIVLLAQFLLGIASNLWVTIGPRKPWTHIGNVGLLAVHGVLGVAIMLMAFVTLGKAFEGQSVKAKAWVLAALVGVIAALGCGVGFVATSGNAALSFGMALGWAVALFANVCFVIER